MSIGIESNMSSVMATEGDSCKHDWARDKFGRKTHCRKCEESWS